MNHLKSILHYQISSIEKTLLAIDAHLGGVDNDESIATCVDKLGRNIFQLVDSMEKESLDTFKRYNNNRSNSQRNTGSSAIVTSNTDSKSRRQSPSKLPRQVSYYPKQNQLLKRFYKGKTPDIMWTKLHRAVGVFEKHLSNQQDLSVDTAFKTWKKAFIRDNIIKYNLRMKTSSRIITTTVNAASKKDFDMDKLHYQDLLDQQGSEGEYVDSPLRDEMRENDLNNSNSSVRSYSPELFLADSNEPLPKGQSYPELWLYGQQSEIDDQAAAGLDDYQIQAIHDRISSPPLIEKKREAVQLLPSNHHSLQSIIRSFDDDLADAFELDS